MKLVYMLAPMEGFTDNSFRTLCYNYGADATFTEMARFESLARRNKST
ncbi:MAG: tRNA-dihydrouridine synthase, partial [Nanoarchaeota archaeon]